MNQMNFIRVFAGLDVYGLSWRENPTLCHMLTILLLKLAVVRNSMEVASGSNSARIFNVFFWMRAEARDRAILQTLTTVKNSTT